MSGSSNVVVRVAQKTPEDFGALFTLLTENMLPESGLRDFGLDFDREATIAGMAEVFEQGIPLIAEQDGRLIGALGLVQGGPWYAAKSSMWCERWMFVLPEARGTGAASKMLKAAQEILREGGVKTFGVGIFSKVDADRKLNWLTRNGFKVVGGTCLKTLEG